MLLVGSFYGRAGGLILLGLLAVVPMAVTTAVGQWDGDRIRETPSTAAQVDDTYDFGAGELVLDLTEVDDVEALDGREIRVEGGAGRIELLVPEDMDVEGHRRGRRTGCDHPLRGAARRHRPDRPRLPQRRNRRPPPDHPRRARHRRDPRRERVRT